MEGQLKQVLSRQSSSVGSQWLPPNDSDDEGPKIDWLSPKPPRRIMQTFLDYAKQLSEKVLHSFKVATTYLPGHVKKGAAQGYQNALEMYSTLKPASSYFTRMVWKTKLPSPTGQDFC